MQLPVNHFKQAILAGRRQIGLWLGLANAYCAEICAGAGFDWLVLDAEHAPNDRQTLLAQLQALAPYPSQPVVRVPSSNSVTIKQVLDLGAQTLLVPSVESAEQAAALVAAMRYPPGGIRGVGTALARASRWNRIGQYLQSADEQMCLLVQVESISGVENLDAIVRVPGVNGVFIGPADLAASLNHRGHSDRPEVQAVIADCISRIRAGGKPAGILAVEPVAARAYLERGCTFVAVGVDTLLLARTTQALAGAFEDCGPRT